MEIGGDRVGDESLLHRRDRLPPRKTPAAVTDIENDSALASVEEIRQQFAVCIQHRNSREVLMSVDISRPQVLQNQLLKRTLRPKGGKVYHYWNACYLSGFDTAIHSDPFRTCVVCHFNTDHHVLI